ncbi:hypothetical protein DRE_02805 [Drechslerella stenobrocha 248]|uniref:HlyIII-domain-containing protein n=1 Tax=Drechslerella stenobrocha 248 TaxID=1043628 RepID=W7I6P8_9PEZI|nr:hypothetical protein DRE_02805 [Drechslerella stenobrocha 248]
MVKDATTISLHTSGDTNGASPRSSVDKPGDDICWPTIATKDQIPGWLRDNDFIITGHPMPTHSYRKSFRLWRCLHMETMNIWTHFVGSIGFAATGFALYKVAKSSSLNYDLAAGDKFAFGISITAATICFGLSATFHTLRSHSYHIHHFWGRMDIMGICVLALGGGASANYYAMHCDPTAQRIYWGFNVGSAALAAITLFDTGGGGNKMRALRGGTFTVLALSAMIPIFQSVGKLGWADACIKIGAQWYLAEGLALLIGVGFFVGRFPERLWPGVFDVWGHSHQLFHICAVAGTAFHTMALVTGYSYRRANPYC